MSASSEAEDGGKAGAAAANVPQKAKANNVEAAKVKTLSFILR